MYIKVEQKDLFYRDPCYIPMGCSLQKQPEESFPKQQKKVFVVKCWERLEWVNMLRQNDLQMDQNNLEVAQENLRNNENKFQERFTNLQENEENLEKQTKLSKITRLKRKRYITN